ncbi:hypothetical protein JCM11491_005980, partial [Sporobolomyces phaffii]
MPTPTSVPPLSEPDAFLALSLSPASQRDISATTPYRFHTHASSIAVEPFISLASAGGSDADSLDLILTPPRATDVAPLVACLNDRRVALELVGPPYPYTDAMAREWADLRLADTRALFARWQAQLEPESRSEGGGGASAVELDPFERGLPFATVRLRDTGEWIGEIGVCRWEFRDVRDEGERARLVRENEARKVGDPELVWSFG